MKYLVLAAAAVVISTAGSSVSRGTRVLLASNFLRADSGHGGPDLRNRETAQQLGTDRHNLQIVAEADCGADLSDRSTA
jgi:hypothetical protein